MEDKTFTKHTFVVEVLADRPIGDICSASGLAALLMEADSGDFVASLKSHTPDELTEAHMAHELLAAGSEPGFFELKDPADMTGAAGAVLDSAGDKAYTPGVYLVGGDALNDLSEAMGGDRVFDELEEDE